jgi:hypothetical protein
MKCQKCKSETSNPKFCSRHCATSWNNTQHKKRKLNPIFCKKCGNSIPRTSYKTRNSVCLKCNSMIVDWSKVTYGSMKCKRAYQKNSRIRELARKAYNDSTKPKKCFICGYDKHYEVCHRPAISSYPPSAFISTINDLNNLFALCRNHHWEFDNRLISI